MEAVELAGVGHYVEGEIEGAAPDVFDLYVAHGVDGEHAAAEDFGAGGGWCCWFRGRRRRVRRRACAVRREAVVEEIIFGVEDHAIARAEFGGDFFRQISVTMM